MQAAYQIPTLPEDQKRLVQIATSDLDQWVWLAQGRGGLAVGSSAALFVGNPYANRVLAEWLREARFYLYRGLVSIQGGDIPDAHRRFKQMLRPHGIEVPPFREERALAEHYLRLLEAAAKPEK
jgi:hypothetical protein